MKPIKLFFLFSLLLLIKIPVYSQLTKGMTYQVETGVNFSDGENTPFWLSMNKYGLSSIKKNNGYLRAGLFRPYEENGKKFNYAYGLDLASAYNFTSAFIVQQAYADFKYDFLELSVGSKERETELKNQELSSGGLTFSKNSRPVPQVRASIPKYWNIPGTKQLFAIKAHIAYGAFTDNNWQKDFANSENKYSKNVLYHSKALFARIGNENKFPLVFEGGLEMAAQFGGRAYNIGFEPYLDMPNGIKDFFKVLIPSGEDATDGEYSNVYGNHLGSWHFALSYKFPDWKIRAYYEHFFEDHSMMFGEYGWKDFMGGLEVTFPKNPVISTLVYEYLITKDQAGPVYHDHTAEIPDQISARDNYYNHGIYTGWQHWGLGIGNPLLLSPIYNEDGKIIFKSNRVKAHHIGIAGSPTPELNYRLLFSHTRSWGTYELPFIDIKKFGALLLEATYSPEKLRNWHFTCSFALDRGEMTGDNTGGMLTIRKTGFLIK